MAIMIDATQIGYAVTAVLSSIAGAVVATKRVAKPIIEFGKEWREFRDDWRGVPDRPGFKGHPGMAERMQVVEAELRPNGGGSLKDAVNRIAEQQRLLAVHGGAPVVASPHNTHGEQVAA
jgi:hypothetical protein